ncbi:hypothetical protein SAMN05892883_0446 [Jatrophihabitans sp. GAS493]|uniref:hypothetical protein n=1 Tax=Jatrophihabitans sp. GAS493 TaxID=1907575 RepID=UPI000BB7E121|nr:hypothetical protein [Jatrophihabitans sp. GAS493]SOD70805.1 hypothetical protein SAMN05892883_0446 [Jatrophihabitans sp. GAS493]
MTYTYGGAQPRRIGWQLGHFAPQILVAAIIAAVALGVHPIEDGTSTLAITLPVLLMFVVLGTWTLMRQHDRRLCERCMSSMPLNPSESAARYQNRFRVAHAGGNKKIVVGYLLALVAVNLLVSVDPNAATRILWAALQLSMIYLIASYSTHRRLQPWCPQCQGGDGRDEDDPVTPDPEPSDHRQLI